MKRLTLAATGAAALVGLTACSHTTAPSAVHVSHVTATHTAVPQTVCIQRYDAWKQGQGKGLVAALNAVSSAQVAGDMNTLTVALKNAEPTVARASRHPIPACADPKGYWNVLLMHVSAATGTHSASSVRAAMKGVPEIKRELTAELKRLPA
jgi:hypothetical protein